MSYIFGGNTGISYSQLQKEREREKQLREMADAMQGRIGTPSTFGAGLTALGAGLAARNKRRKAGELEKSNNAAEAAGRERAQSAFQQLWGSRYGATPDSGSTGGTAAYRDAIASIESAGSGDYGAIGPTNPKLGRALGRYQIMEANIGPWSREALGREVTPDEFLKNPQIQDAIFDHKFNGYVEQFGPEGAAQAWFAGPGGVGKLDRKDVLGTTVADYTDKFRGALGGGTTSARQPQGVQVAGGGATVDQIMQFMASDAYNYATPEQKSALGMLLQQRMQANDPFRRQQLEMGEIELENARNPQTEWKIEELADGRKYYVDPTGRQEPRLVNPGLDAGAGDGEMTESERRIFMFNTIQQKTGPAINRIEDIGFDPSNIRDKLSNGVLGGNWFASKEGQMYEAAAGSWSESALRLATGAAATPEEYQRIRNMYFASVGDDPQTIAFKRSMREAYQGVLEQTLNGKADPNQANPLMFALDQIYGSESAPISSPRPPSRTQETASTTQPNPQWNGPSASEIRQMSPDQAEGIIDNMSDEELSSLPDEIFEALGDKVAEKANGGATGAW